MDVGAVSRVTQFIFDMYRDAGISRVDILFAKYLSLAQQKPEFSQFLPFRFDREAIAQNETLPKSDDEGLPIYEPSRERVFRRFLEMYIQISFYHTSLEGKLSELSSRTIEMEHAAKKADEMILQYRHDYVKRRRMDATLKQLASFAVSQMI
jgi:ATP synthase F1 gamma subunit